ncbi:dolichyl-diphosphooligosaccharide--protein glycosyltransferase subunit [Carex littledalei]|uniref:Dolichyl-diphosphooligosaccharide--protein glycosyltransferase 48 kDa subunit n=1 Tax=Carex littledalei TaxID=544730 RepID=A0A833QN14_9POAL|nr:dolichyl-diphosphooligosaccharide--protein glycosyltransferase subunit [Carex littledalei]
MAKQRPSFLLLFSLINLIISPLPAFSFSGENPTARRLLVLLDDLALRSSHSIFFNSLISRGYQLEFKLADDSSLSLQRYGQSLYDGLILFAPSVSRFGGSLDQNKVLEFVDAGHDLILAVDSSASDLIRGIATDCGADFDEDSEAVVIDHLSYAVSDTEGDHTLIASDNFIKSNVIFGDKAIEAPILFRGIGHSVNPANTLVLKALTASPSAYSANPRAKLSSPPPLTGSAISLVSLMQARNHARVLISGSLEMFSNRCVMMFYFLMAKYNRYEKSGNEQLVTEVAKWVFHERGHLKAINVKHNKVGETTEPGMYRVNDDLEYSVEIYEWSGKSWEPYVADDVQLQFFMMSPYVLKTMSTNKKGLYSTSFKVPDVYGVFQFKVEYERLGYTSVSLAKQIPVRPFKHNEYERFIPAAFPYYTASFSTNFSVTKPNISIFDHVVLV